MKLFITSNIETVKICQLQTAVLVWFTICRYWETHQKFKQSLTKVNCSYFSHLWNACIR